MANSIAWILSKLRFPVPVALGGTGHDGTLIPMASNVSWDTLTTPGQYFIPAATGINVPLAGVNYVLTVVNTANGLKQTAMLYGNPLTYSRAVVSGSWGAWYKAYDQTNIVGTVSQSGGVPTGAIIESGSNANGRYIKYADGTMICTRKDTYTGQNIAGAYGSMFNGQALPAVNYAQAFIAPPVTSQTMTAEGAVCIAGSNGTASATVWPAIFPLAAISYTGAAIIVDRIAIGRWY